MDREKLRSWHPGGELASGHPGEPLATDGQTQDKNVEHPVVHQVPALPGEKGNLVLRRSSSSWVLGKGDGLDGGEVDFRSPS